MSALLKHQQELLRNPVSIKNGLISWLSMDETSGIRADIVGPYSMSPMPVAGSLSSGTGLVGNCAISAVNEYMQAGGRPAFETGDFTVAGAFATTAANFGIIGVNGNPASSSRQWIILIESGVFYFAVNSDGTGTSSTEKVAVGTGLNSGAFHKYICWRDTTANTINVQLDGSAVVSTSLLGTKSLYNSTYPIYMHSIGNGLYTNGGKTDETGMWNRILTTAERDYLYNGGAWRSYPDL